MDHKSVSRLYCESLDRFVTIRQCPDIETTLLIKDIPISQNRKAFCELVISYCVVKYLTELNQLIESDSVFHSVRDIIREELYYLCVQVNPGLDIKKIRVASKEDKPAVPLLGLKAQEANISNVEDLEYELSQQVIGQDEAINVISQCIRRAVAGLRDPKKPVGSFTFVGRTGVGKTEMAKAISKSLYGHETNSIVRIDCSEYSQPHEYSKLIGSPPGYVGYGDGGYLAEAMKKRQNVVVLFDEIEKAHRKVHNLLLQIMDEGCLTDNKGNSIDFSKAIIIMTSNVGVEPLDSLDKAIGFGDKKISHGIQKNCTIKDFKKHFSPEFINRIDEIIVFKDLSIDDMIEISDKMLDEIRDRGRTLGLEMQFANSVSEFIVNQLDSFIYGARPIRRAIQKHIEVPLSQIIIGRKVSKNSLLKIGISKNKIKIRSVA